VTKLWKILSELKTIPFLYFYSIQDYVLAEVTTNLISDYLPKLVGEGDNNN